MITSISKLQKNYDTIIVGGGLSGLLIANHLQNAGQSTLLIDRGEFPGGHCRLHVSPRGNFPHGLKILPNIANAESALQFLRAELPIDLTWKIVERPPVTFEAGAFKPYYGFGDSSPAYIDLINYYTHSEVFELSAQPHQWINALVEDHAGDILAQAFATRFYVEEGKATAVMINGTKQVDCRNIVFCGQPRDLPALFDEGVLPNKVRRVLAKNRLWTSLAYDIVFDQVICEQPKMHVLTGAKDKTQACLGLFQPPDESGQQLAQWLTFIPEDQTEDSELVATALKWVQKQIKRAYPGCFDSKAQDRILVSYASHGHLESPLTEHQTLPSIDNFWVAGPFTQNVPNLPGTLNQARLVLAAMGFAVRSSEISSETFA